MALDATVMENLKKHCPELNTLPKGWTFKIPDDDELRVYFVKGNESTHNHPTLGGLPSPWILKLVKDGERGWVAMYYNRETKQQTKEDPRYMASTLSHHGSHVPTRLQIAATTTKNRASLDINHMKRNPIDYTRNIRYLYTEIHAIDPGDGTMGGMNGGVFIVTMNGVPNQLFIEKRFKAADIGFNKKEIEMMHRLRHPALTNFVAGFILEHEKPPAASVYIEFCNLGSLEELIKTFRTHKAGDNSIKIPEGFVWHAFLGLSDGLAYLRDGTSHRGKKDTKPDPKWVPILHRDIKPDNVLLRSRTTQGSNKYVYCVLSDFGLACEDRDLSHPLADSHQVLSMKLGTSSYFAPELCYTPYPIPENTREGLHQKSTFPPGQRHSRYSDVWALGACIYNLCDLDPLSHLDRNGKSNIPGMDWGRWFNGTASRKALLTIPSSYSSQLRKGILLATVWNPMKRASPVRLILALDHLVKQAGFGKQGANHEPLPAWCLRVHDYNNRAAKLQIKASGR